MLGKKVLTKEKYSNYPKTIDYATFLTASDREVEQFKQDAGLNQRIVIGHVGRFTEAKNHSFLLDIMQAAKKAAKKAVLPTLFLVVDGDVRAHIEAEAGINGGRGVVRFDGR